jgi:hypothetical protein
MITFRTLVAGLASNSVRTSAALVVALCLGTVACGDDDSDSGTDGAAGEGSKTPIDNDDLTGTFTFGGETLDCEVSDQEFPATDEYSIVCDNDEVDSNYRFVQVTFKDEASARVARDLKFIAPYAFKPEDHPDADTIAVQFTDKDGTLDSDDDSSGSAKVTASGGHHVLTLEDVSLSTVTSDATGAVSATIDF